MDEESPQERQSSELQALEAIFEKEFVNCNSDCPEWKPLNVILTVLPQREQSGPLEAHVQINLHVIASEEYPNVTPKILLEKPKGLSDKQISNIQSKVERVAALKVGEVMVFELHSHIQKILTDCNKTFYKSCYEEMLSKQKEKEMEEAKMQKTEEDIAMQLLQLEIEGIKEKRKKGKGSIQENNTSISEQEAPTAVVSPTRRKRTISGGSVDDDTKTKNIFRLCKSNSQDLNASISPDSRLVREFEILNFIGRGAFGDVLQVRNKLDDCLYAIKRIKLNSKNKQTNKKIMREVKLLRSLNHENIVRYYFSWLEDVNPVRRYSDYSSFDGSQKDETDGGTREHDDFTYACKTRKENEKKRANKQIVGAGDLNLSFPRPEANPSFSDSDDDEEEDDDDDDFVEFLREDDVEVDSVDARLIESYELESKPQIQYLYILMAYCEKQTLRDAIDADLYIDEARVWRLLREVVEGLSYIHQQGIIHRDLKPVNIFIDSEDHVKIGDFGLATLNKPNAVRLPPSSNGNKFDVTDGVGEMDCGSYTGQVGTAFYVAPEVKICASRVHYNQKVDIYSLGIIFFEMCYRPFTTQMERHKVLTNLRTIERVYPEDFYSTSMNSSRLQQIKLVKELLNHNPAERPSAAEILEKDYIPPAEVENKKLLDKMRNTLRNPQSKEYKHLMAECFNQRVSTAEDITFDDTSSHLKMAWQFAFIEMISDNARKIFRLHGGTFFSTSFLTPNNGVGVNDGGVVALMTRSGSLVNIPYDIRLAFARYLALNPTVTHMKRYSIDKVFRERRMLGTHPREIFECTFDIVGSNSANLTMEAEMLSVTCEFLNSLSENLQKNCVLRLNHVALVDAILFYNNIETKRHVELCNFLNKHKFQVNSEFMIAKLSRLGMTISTIENLKNMMNVEISPNSMGNHFEHFLKKSSDCGTHCKLALQQLEILVKQLTSLQIKCPVVIAPDVISNFHHYSGVMFQVVWNKRGRYRLEKDIIAAGGRYDHLIMQFRRALKISKDTKQSAVGLTIYADKLINVFQMDSGCQLFRTIDVLVCSSGQSDMINEKLKLMKELWSAEIRSTILDVEPNLEEIQDYCEKMKVYIVYMKESEPGVVRLRSWVKDRFHEKKLLLSEIVPYLKKVTGMCDTNNVELPLSSNNHHHHHYSRSESRSTSTSHVETPKINISFIVDERINQNNKRRYENQIFNSIASCLNKVSPRIKVEVIAMDVEKDIIRTLATTIDVNVKDNNVSILVKRFPKYKKCFHRIIDCIEEFQSRDTTPAVIFFNLRDNNFKLLI